MNTLTNIIILFVRFYQRILSPILPLDTCRFYPSCSTYALQAFQKYGFFKGLFLSSKRILRCNPFHPGGYDSVE